MMIGFDPIESEIMRLVKNQSDVETFLVRLTTDEILLLVNKIDVMIAHSRSEETTAKLLQIKTRISEEAYFREKNEISWL